MTTKKMKVEIWSDVTCTFCYTAKRKFESALSQFKDRDKIEVVWKSFELAPELKTDPNKHFPQFLAELRGISIEQSKGMIDQVAASVKELGLEFNLYKTIPANSFNAHRLSHLAKHYHMQDKTEESLFRAYFTEGRNIDDTSVLFQIANEIGLDTTSVKNMLESSKYTDEVRQDIYEAKEAGVTSVPFFMFNTTTTVSGAQDSKLFLETLGKAFAQWQTESHHLNLEVMGGQSCKIGEGCK
jgi:predicted DsbA family dithiol-disulfide isomerase